MTGELEGRESWANQSKQEAKRLLWKDIVPFATLHFNVWGGLSWAKFAWGYLVKAGLADYVNELERHIILIRLVTLATMFLEFCDLFFDEYFSKEDIAFEEWLDESSFNSAYIWEILGKKTCEENEFNYLDEKYLSEALNFLIDGHRKEVYQALIQGFGDDDKLLVSMAVSPRLEDMIEENDDNFPSFIADEDFKAYYADCRFSYNQLQAFNWMDLGMPPCPKECY